MLGSVHLEMLNLFKIEQAPFMVRVFINSYTAIGQETIKIKD